MVLTLSARRGMTVLGNDLGGRLVPSGDGCAAHGRAKLEAGVGQVAAVWREAALELGAEPVMVGGGRGHGEWPPVL